MENETEKTEKNIPKALNSFSENAQKNNKNTSATETTSETENEIPVHSSSHVPNNSDQEHIDPEIINNNAAHMSRCSKLNDCLIFVD